MFDATYCNLVEKILLKYQQGKISSILISSEIPNEDIVSDEHLSVVDRLLISQFENARSRGILATRRKDLDAAKRFFADARSLLNTKLLSKEGHLWYQSSMDQGESFLDCRYGNFEQARQKLFHSLSIDLELEDHYGHHNLVLHRIQQVHNLARVEAYDSQPQKAIRLLLEVLSYLDGEVDTLSVPGTWGYRRIACQPVTHVTAMFLQVASEIALIMAGLSCEEAGNLFTAAAENFLKLTNRKSCHPYVYQWLLLKLDYSREDLHVFLSRVADFIAQKHHPGTGLLYYGILIDLVTVCDELDTLVANKLKTEIVNDVIINPQKIYPKFLSLLQTARICQSA